MQYQLLPFFVYHCSHIFYGSIIDKQYPSLNLIPRHVIFPSFSRMEAELTLFHFWAESMRLCGISHLFLGHCNGLEHALLLLAQWKACEENYSNQLQNFNEEASASKPWKHSAHSSQLTDIWRVINDHCFNPLNLEFAVHNSKPV